MNLIDQAVAFGHFDAPGLDHHIAGLHDVLSAGAFDDTRDEGAVGPDHVVPEVRQGDPLGDLLRLGHQRQVVGSLFFSGLALQNLLALDQLDRRVEPGTDVLEHRQLAGQSYGREVDLAVAGVRRRSLYDHQRFERGGRPGRL